MEVRVQATHDQLNADASRISDAIARSTRFLRNHVYLERETVAFGLVHNARLKNGSPFDQKQLDVR
ncbi:MAG: hypothetical protein ACI915_003778 [Gammaproteobacteria bacterium]|jgi:hypothetical protein